ncbi:MAG: hypothetical protein WCK93_07605 [Nitrosomonadales bacterium]
MGCTANDKTLNSATDNFDDARLDAAGAAAQQLARMNAETNANATALALQLGYDGSLTVGALEDDVRHYMGRAAEAFFEMGKRLLIIKELTPHGEFQQRLELLGIEYPVAVRSMRTATKFSKVATLSLLKAAGTQSKILELGMLDDGELEALAAGETVRNLNFDKIETMSVRELKAALRERDLKIESKERQIEQKDSKLNELDDQLNLAKFGYKNRKPDDVAEELRSNLTLQTFSAEAAVSGNLRGAISGLIAHGTAHQTSHEDFIVGLLCQIETAISSIRGEFQLKAAPDGDDLPEWMRPDFDPLAAAHGKAN